MSALTPLSARLALAFTPAEARAAVTALDTLAREIRASLAEGLDHTVAHTRLVWWREEVARLTEGAPLHPVSRTLHAAAPAARYPRLEALIIACEFVLAGHQPANEAERAALYRFRRRGWASPPAYLLVMLPATMLGIGLWGLALAGVYAIATLASAIETLRAQV